MQRTFAISAVLLGLVVAGCGDNEPPNGPDASLDGTTGHPDGTDATTASDAGRCTNPTTSHGAACSVEGSKQCGRVRHCTDVVTFDARECTCHHGQFVCGECPSCSADLRSLGCGVGQVCDGVTFTRCDGSVFNVASTCSCSFAESWICDNDGGSYQLGACDAGAGAPDADAPIDRGPDGTCWNPTAVDGGACSVEGSKECGWSASCSDVDSLRTTECICRNGRFVCGECPACSADLRSPGCGFGQVCDGVTFTRCDGSRLDVSSRCRCSFGRSWICDNDGGTYPLGLGACDAGADAPDSDATTLPDADGSSCTCSNDSSANSVMSSLACACQQFACPTYDALTQCPPGLEGGSSGLTLLTYTPCNLLAVERRWGFDTSTYVYDATTHELVGARYATDVNRFTCGSASVFALQGGVFPLANCP
jgi:hypothetical protein